MGNVVRQPPRGFYKCVPFLLVMQRGRREAGPQEGKKIHKGQVVMQWATLGFLAEISFIPLLYHPGGCLGYLEKRTSSWNYNLFVWSAVFQPKFNEIKKPTKIIKVQLKVTFFGILSQFVQFWLENRGLNELDELKQIILLLLKPKSSVDAKQQWRYVSWFLHFFLRFLTYGATQIFFSLFLKIKPSFPFIGFSV